MPLKLDFMSSRYMVKQFKEEDVSNIYALCKRNPTYYKYIKIEPTLENIKEVLTELPPNKTMDDKFFVGFYKDNQLVAILDLITGYPDINTAFISWFMMDQDFQRIGIGTEIIMEILFYLKEENFRYVRLGYIKGNQESESFWIKNKFIPNGIESETDDYTIVVMQREL
ncbi:GNAT family N-acetyltransferase [Clostridium sp. Marseille-P2415]|uniref:GNAT family N-acetyltransferase n=1 Tax=Clostridium sp. Marseille-P2415 TaxID=1805471 RepID=UPI0009887EF1|nr:GNAT family N-acetyltransferase [Clostridium sp. Marseille-P2415]